MRSLRGVSNAVSATVGTGGSGRGAAPLSVSLRRFSEWKPGPRDAVIDAEPGCHSASVVFMHGLGDEPRAGWHPILQQYLRHLTKSKLMDLSHVKWILPCAPSSPVSINMGMKMPSWHDIDTDLGGDFDSFSHCNFRGREESIVTVHQIIEAEEQQAGIPSERVLLAGFSQGGALAIVSALKSDRKMAGVAALSGYLCDPNLSESLTKTNLSTPIRMFHARYDNVVQYSWAEQSLKILRDECGCTDITLTPYDVVGHTTDDQEMLDFLSFVNQSLPNHNKSDNNQTQSKL